MKVIRITDNHTIKRYGHGGYVIIQNYHTLDYSYLELDDCMLFDLELDTLMNSCSNEHELDNKLDTLCEQFL